MPFSRVEKAQRVVAPPDHIPQLRLRGRLRRQAVPNGRSRLIQRALPHHVTTALFGGNRGEHGLPIRGNPVGIASRSFRFAASRFHLPLSLSRLPKSDRRPTRRGGESE